MQRQYSEIKEQYPETILFFRLGDFYEMFGQDAVQASKILGITLTARGKGTESEMEMCGFPHHSAEGYIDKLTNAGKQVAICEQVSDPALPGIVKREVVRVITPGTTLSDRILDEKSMRYLAAVAEQNFRFGIAFSDLSTGEFLVTEVDTAEALFAELGRMRPAEVIAPRGISIGDELIAKTANFHFFLPQNDPKEALLGHFSATEKGLGLAGKPLAMLVSGLLLSYLLETQKNDLSHLQKLRWYEQNDILPLDPATIRNLELFFTMAEGKREGSLLSVIDETQSAAGGRKLRKWLLSPLLSVQRLEKRLDAVSELVTNRSMRERLREVLSRILDLERLLSRLAQGRGNAKDAVALRETLKKLPEIQGILKEVKAEMLQRV